MPIRCESESGPERYELRDLPPSHGLLFWIQSRPLSDSRAARQRRNGRGVSTWTLGEPTRLELRWEIFNVLNRANFDLPNRTFGSPNFGSIFSARSPREMQFGLRLSY